MPARILHSFPHKIGAARICTTAWWEAAAASAAGADITVFAGAVQRPLPDPVRTHTTLARGRLRIPYRVIGTLRALALHDRLVARALQRSPGAYDVVHTWPLAGMETLRTARRLGVTSVVERPNAHTRFAMEVVAQECERLGVVLPPDQEHAFNEHKLQMEEREYELADYLLCPSDFVRQTFLDRGFDPQRLVRHSYGYDEQIYFPAAGQRPQGKGLNALFVGVAAVRKGLHFGLEAWLASTASQTGRLRIAGEFLPDYRDRLAHLLEHPSIEVLGHRSDVPELMRQSDVLLLPTLEEGSALVCMEAVGCGCVPLVSDVCDAVADNALVHEVGDVETLQRQLSSLSSSPQELARLRAACIEAAPSLTWQEAGRRLAQVYEEVAAGRPRVLGSTVG